MQKINTDLVLRYLEQLSGLKTVRGDTVEEFLDRIETGLAESVFPSNSYFTLEHRCGFIEAVMLHKPKSYLRSFVDQMQGTLVIGIEQSSSFSGKHSLFFSYVFESIADFNSWCQRLSNIPRFTRNGLPLAVRFQDDGTVLIAGPVSLLFLQ